MSNLKQSKSSLDTKVFDNEDEARVHGRGGIWYSWKEDSPRNFPDDVLRVNIFMPVNWDDDTVLNTQGVMLAWNVVQKTGPRKRREWKLSGTRTKPTLKPSIHWVDVWHGNLIKGRLISVS